MIIFHGSPKIIERPTYGSGKSYNDYGLGFYCTEDSDMAKEWSVSLNRDGYANRYEIDLTDLSVLNLNNSDYCILHWLAVLLENRKFDLPASLAYDAREYILSNFTVDYQKYDCMIGYRADDSYFSYAQDFLNGTISYRQLKQAMQLGRLGQQFVLKSKSAFERIQFVDYEFAPFAEWYAKKTARDKTARREYFNVEKNRRQRGDLYIAQIMDEEMKVDDARLRADISG